MVDPEVLRWSLSLLIPVAAGISGVALGSWLATRREERQRRSSFVTDQLRLLYSPLLGLRNEIRAQTLLSRRISSAADSAWQRLCAERKHLDPEALRDLSESRIEEFTKIIEYDNRQLAESLIPAYRQMVVLIREHFWLADEDTRLFYPALLEFVDIWERWLCRSLPVEVLEQLDHTEAKLEPFYEHLANRHKQLREQLAAGRVPGSAA